MEINSEIGRLRKVILHRPDKALNRLTPDNCEKFLFDDVLWYEKARKEHEVFEETLKDNGVEVHLLKDLLRETMDNKQARQWLLSRILKRLYFHSHVSEDFFNHFNKMESSDLAQHLIGGITWEEMGIPARGFVEQAFQPSSFILPPLPNHLFTRDTSSWIGKGVSINSMYWDVRQNEVLNLWAIYHFHPMFTFDQFELWYDGTGETGLMPPPIEGGDILVISKDCILVGLSERTTPLGVELLARHLFKKGDKKRVIAIDIPKGRASMHLDTVMTMLNYDTFCVALPCDPDTIRSWSITPGDAEGELVVEKEERVFQAISNALGLSKLNLITPGGDEFTIQREQWSDASNLLAIAPGVVIGYERNIKTNIKLQNHGIDIRTIPGSELGRGRGGSRCMSCPILRDPLEAK